MNRSSSWQSAVYFLSHFIEKSCWTVNKWSFMFSTISYILLEGGGKCCYAMNVYSGHVRLFSSKAPLILVRRVGSFFSTWDLRIDLNIHCWFMRNMHPLTQPCITFAKSINPPPRVSSVLYLWMMNLLCLLPGGPSFNSLHNCMVFVTYTAPISYELPWRKKIK